MHFSVALLFLVLGACQALQFSHYLPGGSRCGLDYQTVLKKHDWVCDESQYQQYPAAKIEEYLSNDTKYWRENEFLKATSNCQTYIDNTQVHGETEYYTYDAICKMNRRPISVIWAKVPDYIVPSQLQMLNKGLLPCQVLKDQNLFDVECTHPWADGIPKHIPRRLARRFRTIRFYGVKRHLCKIGYAYNYNLMCKPSGYMTREVLVYSEHAKKVFNVAIPDIATSCSCSYCTCAHRQRKQFGSQSPAIF